MIDTAKAVSDPANAVVTYIPFLGAIEGIAITPDGAYVYAANYEAGLVHVIDTASNTEVGGGITVGTHPRRVAITPDGAYAYVTNEGSNSVSVIDTASNAVTATIPVGTMPDGMAITPDGQYVYVGNQSDGTVSVIATATNTVVDTIADGDNDYDVAITPDGAYAYVAAEGSHAVIVIDTATHAVTATIAVSFGGSSDSPRGLAITPDGQYVYVSTGGGGVLKIATASNTVVETIDTNIGGISLLSGVAVTPDGKYVYIGDISVWNRRMLVIERNDSPATPIASAAVSVTVPVTGNTPSGAATPAGGSHFTVTAGGATWAPTDDPFVVGGIYTVSVTLTPASGYTFAGMGSATINGHAATVTYNAGGTVTLTYTFPPLGPIGSGGGLATPVPTLSEMALALLALLLAAMGLAAARRRA